MSRLAAPSGSQNSSENASELPIYTSVGNEPTPPPAYASSTTHPVPTAPATALLRPEKPLAMQPLKTVHTDTNIDIEHQSQAHQLSQRPTDRLGHPLHGQSHTIAHAIHTFPWILFLVASIFWSVWCIVFPVARQGGFCAATWFQHIFYFAFPALAWVVWLSKARNRCVGARERPRVTVLLLVVGVLALLGLGALRGGCSAGWYR